MSFVTHQWFQELKSKSNDLQGSSRYPKTSDHIWIYRFKKDGAQQFVARKAKDVGEGGILTERTRST